MKDVKTRRVAFLDATRGLTLISMVLFHAAYDLAYLAQLDMGWFTDGFLQDAWRASISWTFLFLAGWMCGFSRSNFKRGLRYALAALAVYAATSLAAVDSPISFGILYCMAASTLLASILERWQLKIRSSAFVAAACFILFFITYDLPSVVYPFRGLEWLGFPSAGFYSGDYYPLLPYSLLFLTGFHLQRVHRSALNSYPDWMYEDACPPLSWIGRHSLEIYLIHQPLLLVFIGFFLPL